MARREGRRVEEELLVQEELFGMTVGCGSFIKQRIVSCAEKTWAGMLVWPWVDIIVTTISDS
jgi:hypothetical protein